MTWSAQSGAMVGRVRGLLQRMKQWPRPGQGHGHGHGAGL